MNFVPTRRSVVSWAMYDLANTVFALGVGSLFFPVWLNDNASRLPGWLGGGDTADLALAIAIDTAMVLVIVLGPWIGALSDATGSRRHYLIPTTILAVVPTFFIASVGVVPSLVLFVVALVGFNLGSVVYDAMLPDVSTPETIGKVSGFGIGLGYVGSFIAVGIGVVLLDAHGYPVVFRAVAVAFAVLAIPTFLFVTERPREGSPRTRPPLRRSIRGLIEAWRDTRAYSGVRRFLVGRFLYTDAINTLIGGFLTIYVQEELGFDEDQVFKLLAVAIVGSIAGGVGGGVLVDRIGHRRLLERALEAWVLGLVLGIVAGAFEAPALIWPLGVLGGLALGATWAADRVMMAALSPPERLGEFYGLYATVGRFATILGPLLWGLIVTVFGLPREVAVGVLVVFIVAGRFVIGSIRQPVAG